MARPPTSHHRSAFPPRRSANVAAEPPHRLDQSARSQGAATSKQHHHSRQQHPRSLDYLGLEALVEARRRSTKRPFEPYRKCGYSFGYRGPAARASNVHADGQSQAVGRQQLQVNSSTQQQYGHQLPTRNLDRLHPETLVTRRHQRSGDENLEGFREEPVREERLDGMDDEEVDNSVYNAEDEQRQQLIRTLDLLDIAPLIGQEREKRFEDVSREPRRETRRSHKNEGDGETEEKLEEQHNKPDPAPKHNKLKANTSPPQSFSHQSLPSSEVNCHRQPSQSAPAPPPTADDPSPLEIINAHQPFKPHWFNPGTVNKRPLYQVTFNLLDPDMVSTVTRYEKRPRGVHGSEHLQNRANVKKTRENETEDGARSAKEGSGGYGSQLRGGKDEDASASAAIITPAPEVAAYSPVEPILKDPAEPALEIAADLLAEFVSEAAAVTAPEAATRVGEKGKAEDAVEVLEAGEVNVGRKVAKMGDWLRGFWGFWWGNGHMDGL